MLGDGGGGGGDDDDEGGEEGGEGVWIGAGRNGMTIGLEWVTLGGGAGGCCGGCCGDKEESEGGDGGDGSGGRGGFAGGGLVVLRATTLVRRVVWLTIEVVLIPAVALPSKYVLLAFIPLNDPLKLPVGDIIEMFTDPDID